MSSGKILIVDDSENIRSVLAINFESLGYEVQTAPDGEVALGIISSERPDIVILDVMMPRQNGFQVCRKIKSDPLMEGIPVVILSAKGQREDQYWGRDCGADEYVTKPFNTADLERLVERLMVKHQQAINPDDFEAEVGLRRDAGEQFGILTVSFDSKALNTFRQKYGEFRLLEAMDAIRGTMEVIVQEESGQALIWMQGERIFRVILPMKEETARSLCERVVAQSNLLLKSYYDPEDAGRGYVVVRQHDGEKQVHVPLLTLETSLAIEGARKAS